MGDSLERFREDGSDDRSVPARGPAQRRALLLFEVAGTLVGIPAESVDAVIGWQTPARLPCATAGFAGVVQDRGRIVAVLESPIAGAADPARAHRLIVCATPRGYLGLPAETTRGVSTVDLAAVPIAGELVDSSEGPLTFVDPIALLADALRGSSEVA